MNNSQTMTIALVMIVGMLVLAYVLAKQGKQVELNALGMLNLKISV